MTDRVNVICMRWGERYPSHYVNRLFGSVKRNLSRPFRFVCFTNDPAGLTRGIEHRPLPPIVMPTSVMWSPWRKVSIWQSPLADIEGETLFLDLDLVVTGPLDDFFDYAPGKFCIINNWTQPGEGVGNTSVFRFTAGAHPHIFERFMADPQAVLDRHRIEQHFVSEQMEEMVWWPAEWCLSFKHQLVPRFPANWIAPPELDPRARIVVFTGRPDIDEAARGRWPAPWYKKFYKHIRPARWIARHWSDI